MTRSVRFRITALAVLTFVVVAAVSGVALVVQQRRTLRENVDDAVEQRAEDLVALAGRGIGDLELTGGDDIVAQVVDRSGRVLAASGELAGEAALFPPLEGSFDRGTVELPEVDRARYVSIAVDLGGAGPGVVHVAGSLDDVEEATAELAAALAAGIPVVVAVLGSAVWILVGRTLRPVERIRSEVAGFGPGGWRRRVPEPGSGDEVDRLARTMNDMLDRLEVAAERQRRFVDDASHELRSPLTRLRTSVEVALRGSDPADGVLAEVHHDLVELSTLVEDLLVLARADANVPPRRAEVDLDVVALGVIRPFRRRGTTVDTTGIGAARCLGDERLLRRAVENLVRNAARHADHLVQVSVRTEHGRAVLEVADDGPGVPAAERDRIFERFTRLDDARSREAGGTGLGLAIAREIARVHGGDVTVGDRTGGGASFRLVLPADGVP